MNIFSNNQNYFQPYPLNAYTNSKTNQKLFDDQEAFILGNLFRNLYMSYKGFSNYYLQPTDKKQEALFQVQMYNFISLELNLYLDMHPNNKEMLHLLHQNNEKLQNAINDYETNYGPLTLNNSKHSNTYEWLQGPWPWEHQE